MVVTAANLRVDFNDLMSEIGQVVRIKTYVGSSDGSGSNWDNIGSYTTGTTTYCLGFKQPLGKDTAGDDLKFMQEGRLRVDDSKIFITGSVNLSGARVKLGLGSPSYVEYTYLFEGERHHNIAGTTVYKEIYIRELPNGSYYGE